MTVTAASRHLTASMVVLSRTGACVLLVHHNASGLWQFPGGHVDGGEAPHEAAVREVFEETGVVATPIGRPPALLPGQVWHPSPWITAEMPAPAKPERPGKPAEPEHKHIDLLFLGTADHTRPLTPQLVEVCGARWVPIHYITEIDSLPVRAEVPGVIKAAYQRRVMEGW